jgi:hypothetical protein
MSNKIQKNNINTYLHTITLATFSCNRKVLSNLLSDKSSVADKLIYISESEDFTLVSQNKHDFTVRASKVVDTLSSVRISKDLYLVTITQDTVLPVDRPINEEEKPKA